jgi:radical SAM superfamily enzyme YgiQ (UPF0313 family)
MRRRVTFLELPVFAGVLPLASGYMEAYARKRPEIADAFNFTKLSMPVKTPYDEVLAQLLQHEAAVYAFSCYVWNAGLVRRLLSAVLHERPDAYCILGGPQVMRQAQRYLSPANPNVVICNGEGERTFSNFLSALLSARPDFAAVRNLSFYRGDELVTTEPEPRISDLSEIPSPFLEGVFERQKYTWVLLETNRGCPFKCNYCFWGAATGAKVHRYEDRRIERELDWISESGCLYLFIADANWGMLKRDIDLSRYIVGCRERTGSPRSVFFSSSKNTPERVSEISRIFNSAGLVATQSVALQTLNPETLRRVNRDNIKMSTYTQLQEDLNHQGIPSYVELIWPLPGETLASFREGLARLCDLGADCFLVYPLLLMNNVELGEKRDEYGLVTIDDPDPNSEAQLVVRTREVSARDYAEGARYVYALTGLYTVRGLWTLGRYLRDEGLVSYEQLFVAFVEFCKRMPGHPWTRFCEDSIRTFDHVTFSNMGALIYRVLHAERDVFDELLERFVGAQAFWSDPAARFLFEIDLVSRPYVYGSVGFVGKKYRFTQLGAVKAVSDGYDIDVPAHHLETLRKYVPDLEPELDGRFHLNHKRGQMPLMRNKPLYEQHIYCQDVVHRVKSLMPRWELMATTKRELLRAVES